MRIDRGHLFEEIISLCFFLLLQTTQLAYTVGDLLSKFVQANVLSDANLMDLWTEQAYRTQIAQKQQANEAQRYFLR